MTWVVTGAGGQLGSVIFHELQRRGDAVLGLVSPWGPAPADGHVARVDLTDIVAVTRIVEEHGARRMIHAAAISSVATCLEDPGNTRRVNVTATGDLARLAMRLGMRFVYTSTDMVFDGEGAPYREHDEPSPLSAYGRSKREGELAAKNNPNALVLRLPLLYGLPAITRRTTFVSQLDALRRSIPLTLFTDEYRTPLWLPDAATAVIRAAESDLCGTLHVAGPERLSRHDMGLLLAERLGASADVLCATSRLDAPAPEPRARDLSLDGGEYLRHFGVPAGRPMRAALAGTNFDGNVV